MNTSRLALVALLLVGGCTPAAPRPAPVVSSTAVSRPPSASPAAAPVAQALLSPSEMGSGYAVSSDAPETDADVLHGTMTCPDWVPGMATSSATRTFSAPRGHYDAQSVLRLPDATAMITMLRAALDRCADQRTTVEDGVVARSLWDLMAEGFAGPDSVAIRLRAYRDRTLSNTDYFVIVRKDSVLTAFWLSDQRWTAAHLTALGRRAAAKLALLG